MKTIAEIHREMDGKTVLRTFLGVHALEDIDKLREMVKKKAQAYEYWSGSPASVYEDEYHFRLELTQLDGTVKASNEKWIKPSIRRKVHGELKVNNNRYTFDCKYEKHVTKGVLNKIDVDFYPNGFRCGEFKYELV